MSSVERTVHEKIKTISRGEKHSFINFRFRACREKLREVPLLPIFFLNATT